MIIARSPLRISLGGGGTDLPSYYQTHTGFVVAAAIDRYVYVSLHRTFVEELLLKYSQIERVHNVENIRHPLIRLAFVLTNTPIASLEMTSMADIHAGTGLGSSASFTTALLKALYAHRRDLPMPSQSQLAELACHIEMSVSPSTGKQDQYIATHGGLTTFTFHPSGEVTVNPLHVTEDTLRDLEENLLLFYTGRSHDASTMLWDQDQKSRQQDTFTVDCLHQIKEIGYQSANALAHGHLSEFSHLMNDHWMIKTHAFPQTTTPAIDRWYTLARQSGALGGKLVGAGGGGFLLFYATDKSALRRAMHTAGLSEAHFRFDFDGTTLL